MEAEDGVLVPVIRNADKRSLKEMVDRYNELVELARQRRLPAGCHRRFDRHRDKFRNLRSDLGHADSVAGTNAGAWAWARAGSCRVGMRPKASSCP